MENFVEFELENGQKILIQNTTKVHDNDAFVPAGDAHNASVIKASQTFESAIQKIKPVAIAIADTFKAMTPDELEIEFGLKMTAEAGAIISSISSEVNFQVKMTWKK